jgi:hypothetical protein
MLRKFVFDIKERTESEVFENRALERMFGPKRAEIIRGWRKLRNEELCTLYSSPNIITLIKFRRMRWEGNVAHIRHKRNACAFRLVENLKEKDD